MSQLSYVFNVNFSFFPWWIDCIYYSSAHGRKFSQTCDYVHDIADEIVQQRRQVLVGVYMYVCVCI